MTSPREALTRWAPFLQVAKAEKTVEAYSRDIEGFVDFCEIAAPEVVDVRDLDLSVLRRWLSARADAGGGPPARARATYAARTWFRWMLKQGLVTANPADDLRIPKIRPRLPVFLNERDAATLVEAPTKVRAWTKLDLVELAFARACLELLYGSGLRVSELVGVNLDDLKLTYPATVHVLGKGGKERLVPLGRKSIEALRAWLKVRRRRLRDDRPTEALFLSGGRGGPGSTGDRGRRVSVRTMQRLVRGWGKVALARDDLHPHSLRHTCATHMLEGGANLRALQEFLGHAKLRTTVGYAHVSPKHMVNAYEAHPLARRGGRQLDLPGLTDEQDVEDLAPLAKTRVCTICGTAVEAHRFASWCERCARLHARATTAGVPKEERAAWVRAHFPDAAPHPGVASNSAARKPVT